MLPNLLPAPPIVTICHAPSEKVNSKEASLFGDIAEAKIIEDYCSLHRCQPMVTDFFDVRGIGDQAFIAFLVANNPRLAGSTHRLAVQAKMKDGGLVVPDILSHKPNRKEFYEIKPNSGSGLRDGLKKLRQLEAFLGVEGLPYSPGLSYPIGVREIEITRFRPVPKIEVLVLLKVETMGAGLIGYKICLRSSLPTALLAVLVASVIIALTRGKALPKLPIPAH